jgi:hypothetical protein
MTNANRSKRYAASVVRVRAPITLSRLRWLVEHHGEAAYDATLAQMKPEHAKVVRESMDHAMWVPFDAYVDLSVAIDARYGKGDLALCRDLGRYAARVNLPTLYRVFYMLGSVKTIMGKATSVWSEHYDSGRAYARDVGPGEVAVIIEDFATPHAVHCLGVLGWAEESIAISGAKVLSAEEVACRRRGDPVCELRARYA